MAIRAYLYFISACTAYIGYNNIIMFLTRINKNVKQLSRPTRTSSHHIYMYKYYIIILQSSRAIGSRRLHLRVNLRI